MTAYITAFVTVIFIAGLGSIAVKAENLVGLGIVIAAGTLWVGHWIKEAMDLEDKYENTRRR